MNSTTRPELLWFLVVNVWKHISTVRQKIERYLHISIFSGLSSSHFLLQFLTSSIVYTIHSQGRSSWLLASLINSLHTIFLLNYFKITRKTRINSRKLGQKLPAARHFDILCTFAVTWHAINQNKEFVLWRPPAFITSIPLLTLPKCISEIIYASLLQASWTQGRVSLPTQAFIR